jgi:hypothetical protein
MPTEIKAEEAAEYFTWLGLSQEQQNAAWHFYNDYLEQWTAQFGPQVAAYVELRNEAYEVYAGSREGSLAAAFDEVHQCAARLRGALHAQNELFLSDLMSILAEPQLTQLHRVELALDRKTYQAGFTSLRETNVDLVELICKAKPGEQAAVQSQPAAVERHSDPERLALSDEQMAAIAPVIQEFEVQFVAALKQFALAHQKSRMSYYEAADVLRGAERKDDLEARRAAEHKFHEIVAADSRYLVPVTKRLVNVNRAGLRRLKERLPAVQAEELQRLYNRRAYPEVYPDPARSDHLFEAVAAFEDLMEEQRDALAVLRDQYFSEHAALSEKMATSVFERGLNWVIADPKASNQQLMASWRELEELGLRRERLNESQYARVHALLLPEQVTRAPRSRFEGRTPPRPWSGTSARERRNDRDEAHR